MTHGIYALIVIASFAPRGRQDFCLNDIVFMRLPALSAHGFKEERRRGQLGLSRQPVPDSDSRGEEGVEVGVNMRVGQEKSVGLSRVWYYVLSWDLYVFVDCLV